jgi:hypothetical protein
MTFFFKKKTNNLVLTITVKVKLLFTAKYGGGGTSRRLGKLQTLL